MFQGAEALSLDTKGRLAIPARHRDLLVRECAGRMVVTAHLHRCLLLFPEAAWEPIRTQVLAAPSFEARSAAAKRVLVGNAREVELDAAGRLLIAPELRSYAGLDKAVRLVGLGSHFEIWGETEWLEQHELARTAFMSGDEPPPGFAGIAL